MPRRGEPLRKLGFLTIGRFDPANPGPGMEETLRTIERAEALGYDSVWLRDRHLQPGISSPVAIMAAASQRTSRIELGTAVIPLGLENPFRLAEDLATVDILSGGRINPGVSVGTPMLYDHYKTALYPESHDTQDFSKERVRRLLRALRGEPVSDFAGTVGIEQFTDRIQPHSPGLADRVWYGGGLESARWAGEQGINYLTSSVVSTEHISGAPVPTTSPPSRASRSTPIVRATRDPKRQGCHRVSSSSRPTRPPTTRPGATASTPPADSNGPPLRRDRAGCCSPRLRRHLRRTRRPAVRPCRLPARRRGGVRAPIHVRLRRLHPDHRRHRRESRPAPGVATTHVTTGGQRV